MAADPVTFADIALLEPDKRNRAVINTFIDEHPLLGVMPFLPWPGGESTSMVLNKTLPTVVEGDETSQVESTASLRIARYVYLAQLHARSDIPVFGNAFSDVIESEEIADLIRAIGDEVAAKLITGGRILTTDCTINTGLATTKGIDAVTAVSAFMPRGYGAIKYDDGDDTLQFRSPGSDTYGAAVDVSGLDADYELADGVDTSQTVTITLDHSDSDGADWEDPEAILFGRPSEVAGLKGLAAATSAQENSASTNGDTLTLTMLDELTDTVKGPDSELAWVMHPRTRRQIKALIGAAGGTTVKDWQGRALSKAVMGYEDKPIFVSPSVSITETQGTASAECTRIYLVRFNANSGLHGYYAMPEGPNEGTKPAVYDGSTTGPVTMPLYLRKLPESGDYARYPWKISAAMTFALRSHKSCAYRKGIKA